MSKMKEKINPSLKVFKYSTSEIFYRQIFTLQYQYKVLNLFKMMIDKSWMTRLIKSISPR